MGKEWGVKLHLGSGSVHLPGYINIDANPAIGADMVLDLTKPLPYDNNSIEEIISYHFVEHLNGNDTNKLFSECYRVLIIGGALITECPDILEICKAFVSGSYSERYLSYRGGPALITHIYGLGSNQWEYHKNGYDLERLKNTLKQVGFKNFVEEEANKVIKDYQMPALRLKATK